jgi:hypothetical protein
MAPPPSAAVRPSNFRWPVEISLTPPPPLGFHPGGSRAADEEEVTGWRRQIWGGGRQFGETRTRVGPRDRRGEEAISSIVYAIGVADGVRCLKASTRSLASRTTSWRRIMGNIVTNFEYVTPDGRKLTASVNKQDLSYSEVGPIINTTDPRWILTGAPAMEKWMGYKGGDGRLWWTTIHAHWDPGLQVYQLWYEHRGAGDPPGGRPENLPELHYGPNDKYRLGHYDWSGLGWYATIRPCGTQAAVTFEMDPMGR